MKDHRTLKTILAMGVLLLVFFLQGAVVAIGDLDGIASAVVRGAIIWGLALITTVFYLMRHKRLDFLGFAKPRRGAFKRLYYFVPPIAVALAGLSFGVDADIGFGMLFANLFLTLGIGFCEELYFRGIICGLWMGSGARVAVAVSSALFALCHLMNIAGGAGAVETVLQVCFALVYGVVFALIFISSRSIWPCVALHAFHDFCSFVGADGAASANAAVGAVQFAILLCYIFVLVRKNRFADYPAEEA